MFNQSEEAFSRLMGLAPKAPVDISNSSLTEITKHPLHRINQAATIPLDDYLKESGFTAIPLPPEQQCTSRSQGKFIASVIRQQYRSPFLNRVIDVFSASCAIDERFYPMLPTCLSEDGQPVELSKQVENFEYTHDASAVLIDTRNNSVHCHVLASATTYQCLQQNLKKASDTVGIWQGAKGAGFFSLLSSRSSLLGVTGWYIDHENQQKPERKQDYCIGFSAINASDFPYVFGRAVIATNNAGHSVCTTSKNALYEVSFETHFHRFATLPSLSEEAVDIIGIDSMTTHDLRPFNPLAVESWVAAVHPQSYLHARAMKDANGNSDTTARRVRFAWLEQQAERMLES
jgi:hypothetical protein